MPNLSMKKNEKVSRFLRTYLCNVLEGIIQDRRDHKYYFTAASLLLNNYFREYLNDI